ncbi:hypothetical protein H9Q13_14365 [Pontibacter sp. JH31]|uniref:Homing endonuclease LAGLIDADG domain-containing protein n=1 Tax=Pontibacter aquaedesilientis TaxID=2766980 RepID=A0ABR7XJA9_9BACT|nr:hypothetical protein [Pontibacter aquaedesilientis]MBD1398352.1 hypothetical protein [Pontibacter aquaedesilientis]
MDANAANLFHQRESWIPVQLALHAERASLIEELKVYVALKMLCSGKIKANSRLIKPLREHIGIKCRKTFKKHLNKLIALNWIGHNESSNYIFIRSYNRICSQLEIPDKTYVWFETDSFRNFREFVFASIVCCKINHIKYAKQRNRRGNRLVPQYRVNGTNPSLPSTVFDYNGLSVHYISELIGKSLSRCSELRQAAHRAGFLITKQKYQKIDVFPKSRYIKDYLKEKYPTKHHRLKCRAIKNGENKGRIAILEQLENEIIPLIRFRKK